MSFILTITLISFTQGAGDAGRAPQPVAMIAPEYNSLTACQNAFKFYLRELARNTSSYELRSTGRFRAFATCTPKGNLDIR